MPNVLTEAEYKETEIFLLLKYGSIDNIVETYIEKENDETDFDLMTNYLSFYFKDSKEAIWFELAYTNDTIIVDDN